MEITEKFHSFLFRLISVRKAARCKILDQTAPQFRQHSVFRGRQTPEELKRSLIYKGRSNTFANIIRRPRSWNKRPSPFFSWDTRSSFARLLTWRGSEITGVHSLRRSRQQPRSSRDGNIPLKRSRGPQPWLPFDESSFASSSLLLTIDPDTDRSIDRRRIFQTRMYNKFCERWTVLDFVVCDPRKFPERIPRTSYLGQTTSGRGETHPPGESVASCAVALFAAFLSRNCRDRSPPDPRDFDHEESWWNDGKKRRRWHAAPWYRDTDTPRSLSAQRRQTTSGTFLAILLHIRGYTRGESEPSWRQIAWLQEGRTRPRTEIV